MQEVCALPKCPALLGASQTPPQKSGCEAGPGGGRGGVPAVSPPPPSPGYPQPKPSKFLIKRWCPGSPSPPSEAVGFKQPPGAPPAAVRTSARPFLQQLQALVHGVSSPGEMRAPGSFHSFLPEQGPPSLFEWFSVLSGTIFPLTDPGPHNSTPRRRLAEGRTSPGREE
ncbi:unnamed protein product [Rangifer tarandus platyrhynchus]|uniref:Uncharacterized protein n=1 Tax=Rangifer tarandus platyrhynchus TaxID=3082113 RepID=A0AC59ZUP7_RANTA